MQGASSEPLEIEWQLDAPDLEAVARWIEAETAGGAGEALSIGSGHDDNHVDTYLDTEDGRLRTGGYSVRIRLGDNEAIEATLKSLGGRQEDGPRTRLELTEELEGDEPSIVAAAPGAVGQQVRALVGSQRLVPLFEAETRRRVFPLELDGQPAGELTLDDTTFRAAGGTRLSSLRRVEVELPQLAVEAARGLVERLQAACTLTQADLSKYEIGLAALRARAASSRLDDDAAPAVDDPQPNPSRKEH
jgi:inorganic triphosphatase YgiF